MDGRKQASVVSQQVLSSHQPVVQQNHKNPSWAGLQGSLQAPRELILVLREAGKRLG